MRWAGDVSARHLEGGLDVLVGGVDHKRVTRRHQRRDRTRTIARVALLQLRQNLVIYSRHAKACNSLHRRLARSSTLAVTKILWLASGRTTVPMSRPASTAPGAVAELALKARSARRTSGIAATTDAPWLTASLRSVAGSRSAAVTARAAAPRSRCR